MDRIPVWSLAAVVLVGWLGAAYYVPRAPLTGTTPFTWVWAAYDTGRAAQLVGWCLLGVALALWLPMGRGVTLPELAGSVSVTLNRLRVWWLLIAVTGVALLVYVKGPLLLTAPRYLEFTAPGPLVSIANLMAPVTAVAAGITSLRRPVVGWAVALAMIVVLFAYSTRVFAGVAVLFLLGRVLAGARAGLGAIVATLAYTVFALPIPLMNRDQQAHGLLPYLEYTRDFVTGGDFVSGALLVGAENVGFSVPLLVYVADHAEFSARNLLVSVNPLPASLAGWTEISDAMRVHLYIPFSMLGELAHVGGPVLAGGVALWGVVVRLCLQRVTRPGNPLMPFFTAGMLGLSMICVVYSAQYNTRAVARLLWVMVLVVALDNLVRRAWRLYRGWRARGRPVTGVTPDRASPPGPR